MDIKAYYKHDEKAKQIILKVLNFAGIKFCDFAIFSLNREIKYQGETFQVYNREIKYPRNLISGGSKTAFYHKKYIYFNYIIITLFSFCCPSMSLLRVSACWNNVLMSVLLCKTKKTVMTANGKTQMRTDLHLIFLKMMMNERNTCS